MADEDINLGDIAQAAFAVAAAYGLSYVVGSLQRQKGPSVSSDISWQQPLPPVISFVGDFSRTAGAVLFKEAKGSIYDQVFAFGDGRHEVEYVYLGDDRVDSYTGDNYVLTTSRGGAANDDGRYEDNRVQIRWNVGLSTETAFAEIVEDFPALWTEDHRGDGTGTLMVRNIAPKAKFFAQAFPTGRTDTVAISARRVCFDWRDPSQDREDESTWQSSANPLVWLVQLEWTRWGTDWDESIAPVIDDLTAEADICDEVVALAAGGTEPRYTVAFNYNDEEDERSVRGKLLAAMDGFYTFDGFDRLIVRAGKYRAPTVEFLRDPGFGEIIDVKWFAGTSPDQAVSEINVRFTNAATDYNPGDVDPWPVSDRGRPDDLDLTSVTSWTQARRLAKRRAARVNPARRGTIVTDLRGMAAWSEQYIRLRNVNDPTMDDVVVEIVDAPEQDIMAGTVTFQVILADPDIDAWNPATEEGNPPATLARVAGEALADPVIASATAQFVDTTSARISIAATGPARDDITWSGRWSITGGSWNEFTDTSVTGASVTLSTGTLPVNTSIDVAVMYRTGGGAPSNWSATTTVSTSTASIPPGPVTSPTATGGAGKADLTWVNPVSSNYNRVVIRRATTSAMTGAVEVATIYGSPGEDWAHSDTGLSAGTYYYTFTAYNTGTAASTTPSPQPVSAIVT